MFRYRLKRTAGRYGPAYRRPHRRLAGSGRVAFALGLASLAAATTATAAGPKLAFATYSTVVDSARADDDHGNAPTTGDPGRPGADRPSAGRPSTDRPGADWAETRWPGIDWLDGKPTTGDRAPMSTQDKPSTGATTEPPKPTDATSPAPAPMDAATAAPRPTDAAAVPTGEPKPTDVGKPGEGKPVDGKSTEDVKPSENDASTQDSAEPPGTPVPCDPNALIEAILLANGHGGGSLALAKDCRYVLTTNQDGAGLPTIVVPLKIVGNGATIERAAASIDDFRILTVGPFGDLTLKDVTIKGGRSSDGNGGGGIWVQSGARAAIDSSVITANLSLAGGGGGIANLGILFVKHSTLSDNNSLNGSGGGAVYTTAGVATIEDSLVARNYTDDTGGGLYSTGTFFLLRDSTVRGNQSGVGGGGVFLDGQATIDHSLIQHNQSTFGAGVQANPNLAITIRDSLIAGNSASDDGGGIGSLGNSAATLLVENTQLVENTAGDVGGGIFTGVTLTLRHSLIRDNRTVGLASAGGGIFGTSTSTISLVDTRVTENHSTIAPGGVGTDSTALTLDATSVIIANSPTNCAGSPDPITGCFG